MRVFLFLFVFMAIAVSATGVPGKNTYPPGQSTETKADKKDNVKKGKKFTQPEEPAEEEPAVEEPAVEEPAVEEPAVEEPAVEEPAVEEPTVEEPTVEEPTALDGFSLENVSNFRVYYSDITPEILEEMKLFDLVIVETLQLTDSHVTELHNSGTKVYGYLSAMETPHWDEEINAIMEEQDYLFIDGVQEFSNGEAIGDLREPGFREALLQITQSRIEGMNLDGVFVDSTANMDYYLTREDIGADLTNGYVQFLSDLDASFPNLEVMQNRGFDWIEPSAPYLDSVLWEDFKSPRTNGIERYWDRIDLLNSFDFEVAVISYENEQENREHAQELGWVYLYHPDGVHHDEWVTPTEAELAQ